jgi:hypothetical protein
MKTKIIVQLLAIALTTGSVMAADSAAKDQLVKAARALAEKPNYSWKTTVVVPEDTQFKPGPTDGKVVKDGYIMISQDFGPGTLEIVKKGEKAAMTNQDGGWDSMADLENDEGFGRFRAMMARNLMAPAEDVVEIVGLLKEVKMDGGVYSGEFTEEGAKGMIGFGGRRRGNQGQGGPTIPFAKGSAKFWVSDEGVLSKMEIKVDGSMEFNGNEMEIVRTTTTEIKDIGTTKVEVPEGARAKLK